MRVLILSPALGTTGGIQRYTAALLRAFADVVGDGQVRCLALPDVSQTLGPVRLPVLSRLHYLCQAFWQNAVYRPDLIMCTHLSLGPIGWLLARLGGCPYWIVAHGIEAWVVLPRLKHGALSRANRVIVTSKFSRDLLVERQGIAPDLLVNPPCALDPMLLNIKPVEKADLAFLGGRRVLLTVSRMIGSERYKGQDVVLKALPSVVWQVPDLAYVIVGDGDDRPRLQKLAADLGLGRYVFFTGITSDAELAALYQRSEVFVLPARTVIDDRDSKGEGFGIVFLEAMAYGKPVIGPDYGAPRELIRSGENGLLVDPEDVTSVAEAILSLLANPEAARQMGKTGQTWAQTSHSYASFRGRLLQILRTSYAGQESSTSGSCAY